MTALFDRRLLFVTGKGGTGKTTVAVALAKLAAQSGKRVLLCEIDATGNVADSIGTEPLEFDAREIEPGLSVMQMNTESALQEYLRLNLKLPFSIRMGPLAKAFDFVAAAAPGVREILTIGKLCWEVKRENYDLVIVDAAATGHIVGQLDSPSSIGELIKAGPLVSQTAWMRDILRDPQRTGAVIVTTPEEMPVSETLDLVGRLTNQTQTPIGAIVVNRVLPELFVKDETKAFDKLRTPEHLGAFKDAVGPGAQGVLDAAVLATALRRTQVGHLQELHNGVDPVVPLLFVPFAFGLDPAASIVDEAVVAMGAELQ